MILLRVLVDIPLDDGELCWVAGGLRDEPGDCLLIVRIDARRLDELRLEDFHLVWLCFEVDYDCIDHTGRYAYPDDAWLADNINLQLV